MLVVWGVPYGLAAFYDFLLGQEFLPKEYQTLSNILPNWTWIWLAVGAIAFLIVTLEGTYRYAKRMQTRYESKESGLRLTIRRLQDNLKKSAIELVFDDNYPNCMEIVIDDEIGLYYIYRIGIRNIGSKTIEEVVVDLFEFSSWSDEQDEHSHRTHAYCTLKPMNYKAGAPYSFTVHPGYAITNFVDVFIWKPDKKELEICCTDRIIQLALKPKEYYDLTLLAKGRDIPQTSYSLYLGIGKEKKSGITVEEIEEFELGAEDD